MLVKLTGGGTKASITLETITVHNCKHKHTKTTYNKYFAVVLPIVNSAEREHSGCLQNKLWHRQGLYS